MSQSPGICRCGYVLLADGRCAHCYSTIGWLTGETAPIGIFNATTMSDRVEAALTPDLLSWMQRDIGDVRYSLDVGMDHISYFLKGDLAKLIALANAALPDSDPRKITHRHVQRLRDIADSIVDTVQYASTKMDLEQLADALESYLPPPAHRSPSQTT